MRKLALTAIGLLLFIAFFMRPATAQVDASAADLTVPFDWPTIGSQSAGIQLSLRTRFRDGVLEYVAVLNDGKGRIARYLAKHSHDGTGWRSSFSISFLDESNFTLYNIPIYDSTLSKLEGTRNYQSAGKSRCPKETYLAALKAAKAAASNQATLELSFPTELTEFSTAPSKKQ